MNRTLLEDGREVPSVIKEIVIYDKPNKPFVPYDIFSEPNVGQSYPSGDIVLSRANENKSLSKGSNQEGAIDVKLETGTEIKEEPDDEEEIIEDPTEIGEETVNENSSDLEESIENISKEISKLAKKQPTKKATKVSQSKPPLLRTYSRKKAQPNVKIEASHRQHVQKNKSKQTTATKTQPDKAEPKKKTGTQSTILNFLIKPQKQNVLLETSSEFSNDVEDSTEETVPSDDSSTKRQSTIENITENYFSSEGRQKRIRKIPKKYQDGILLDNVSIDQVLNGNDEMSVPKKKKYTELKAVPYPHTPNSPDDADELSSNSDNLEALLNDAEEQVKVIDEVEAELQKMANQNELSSKSKVNNVRARSLNQSKAKTLDLEETIKVEEIDEEFMERAQQDDESDDSRQEWVPDEYVEYKRQHVLKKTATLNKCKFCKATFNSYYAMRKHRALEHEDVGSRTRETTYIHQEGTEIERDAENAEMSDEESRGEWLPEDYAEYKLKHKLKKTQWHKCKICCAVFSNYYKLSKHRVEHEKQSNPYDCKQCDAKFKDVETFTAHIRNHQGKDPYSCKKCDKGFISKQELTKHEEVHILKKPPALEKRYRCEVCAKEFHKLCDIERHTRVHTGEKPSQCTICHKRFQQPYNLSKHLLTHLHVKPFQCEICNKKFGRIDVLNRHLLTHSIEKPFKCVICGKGFIRQVQLNNHMGKSHPGLNNVRSIDEVSITPVV